MLKNIFFDCGGVVCRYEIDEILSHFFSQDEKDLVRPVIYRNWQGLDAGEEDYEAYARESEALVPDALKSGVRRFFENWYKVQPPIEEIWVLIARLKARGYRVYLLSNAPVVYDRYIATYYPVVRMMDGMIISSPIRKVKPNADIFEYALEKYGCRAEESLFVDDMEVNCQGARAVGLHAFCYRNNIQALYDEIERLTNAPS